jgi:hypothetical protein
MKERAPLAQLAEQLTLNEKRHQKPLEIQGFLISTTPVRRHLSRRAGVERV